MGDDLIWDDADLAGGVEEPDDEDEDSDLDDEDADGSDLDDDEEDVVEPVPPLGEPPRCCRTWAKPGSGCAAPRASWPRPRRSSCTARAARRSSVT
jgi:hypothetical protein